MITVALVIQPVSICPSSPTNECPSEQTGRNDDMTQKFSLTATVLEHLEIARRDASGRSSQTVYGGHEHALRQTVIALTEGQSLREHNSPGEATIYVLTGRVRLSAGDVSWDGK